MTFGEAMVALEQGKRVRCKKWDLKDYIFMNSDKMIFDQYGHSSISILFKSINEEWEECNWGDIEQKTRVVFQVRCPYCFTYSCREVDDVHFIYCPHCGSKVVK